LKHSFNKPVTDKNLSLDALPLGTPATVNGYADDFPEARRERFEDLGLLIGTPLKRVHTAPLGDPLAFAVRGNILCLRREDARHIKIRISA
jgi:ferrous iron transport protein A